MRPAVLLLFLAVPILRAEAPHSAPPACVTDGSPGNVSFGLVLPRTGGLQFRLAQSGNARQVLFSFDGAAASAELQEDGRRLPAPGLASFPLPKDLKPGSAVPFLLQVRPLHWKLYAGDRPLLLLPPPFAGPAALLADPPADGAPLRARFQKTAPFRFSDDFMAGQDETDPLGHWEILSGSWRIHTVLEEILNEDGRKLNKETVKKKTPSARFSPNFYNLEGSGRGGIIVTGHPFHDAYALQAALCAGPGTAGLVFSARGADDFLAFTMTMREEKPGEALLRLWRMRGGARQDLAAGLVPMQAGEWVQARVRLYGGRVAAELAGAPVFDLPLDPGPGGRYGLFADTDEVLHFDDVAAWSNPEADLRDPAMRRILSVARSGAFPEEPAADGAFRVPAGPEGGRVVFGVESPASACIRARFRAASGTVGLIAAWQPDGAHLLFTREVDGDTERFRVARAGARLGEIVLPRTSTDPGACELALDGREDGLLRFYRDGELALVHLAAAAGGLGVAVGAGSAATVSDLSLGREERPYSSRHEKNRAFVEDPFMRHWSSPEGEWWKDGSGLTWLKGDVLGRLELEMPWVPGSRVHLGVAEGRTEGNAAISASGNRLLLSVSGDAEPAAVEVPLAADRGASWSVLAEGNWLLLGSGGNVLLSRPLPGGLSGRRLRIAGFPEESLARSRCVRGNVLDTLFTEAPCDWTVNGGEWQVINRFYCDPRWSHMVGENADGLAALWTRLRFAGDFCLEMYAGLRMGWYERCGDLNLTALAALPTTGRGYSVTCTGWDQDHSQLWTRLWREGTMLDSSDRYLVPRIREGNKRRSLDPLVGKGRDVHGAWYYLKLRRAGGRLEYSFDNGTVFSRDAADGPPEGHMGVWTYRNSMTVARVKVSAARILPPELPVRPCAAGVAEAWLAAPAPVPAGPWAVEDPVGRSVISWPDGDGAAFRVANVSGGGAMSARCLRPAAPRGGLAGWRFQVRRSPRCGFNFHYSLVRLEGDGSFKPVRRFFHRISGDGFGEGEFAVSGNSEAPGDGRTWTAVTVFPPPVAAEEKGLWLQADGFGLLQPSYEEQGLLGNGPGEWYEVRDFTEIRLADKAREPEPGIEWVVLPAKIELDCAWDRTGPPALRVSSGLGFPDPRLADLTLAVNGVQLPLQPEGPGAWTAWLSRDPALVRREGAPLEAVARAGGTGWRFVLRWEDGPPPGPPVLVSLTGAAQAILMNDGRNDDRLRLDSSRVRVLPADPEQDGFLRVQNRERGQRLAAEFALRAPLARYPLLGFRYRGEAMSRVSLGPDGRGALGFSEAFAGATANRPAFAPRLDGAWHGWCCFLSDAVRDEPWSAGMDVLEQVRFGSRHGTDQTGRFSRLDLDDLVLGPAVPATQDLALRPEYVSFAGGPLRVFLAASGRNACLDMLDGAARAGLAWTEHGNGETIRPPASRFADGLCHLFLKARDASGQESALTDIPFLLDSVPPLAKAAFIASDDPLACDSLLRLDFRTGGGAPLDLSRLRLSWEGKAVEIEGPLNRFARDPEADHLTLNWPCLLRARLDALEQGRPAALVVSGIVDGAGNQAPDLEVALPADAGTDRSRPVLICTTAPSGMLDFLSLEGWDSPPEAIQPGKGLSRSLVRNRDGEPHWRIVSLVKEGEVAVSLPTPAWKLAEHPFLALRARRLKADARYSLVLRLELPGRRQLDLALSANARADGALWTGQALAPDGEWHSLVLDLAALAKVDQDAKKDSAPAKLSFLLKTEDKNAELHLRSLVAFAPWNGKAELAYEAFDPCGIRDLAWEHLDADGQRLAAGEVAGRVVRPLALVRPAPGGWLLVRGRDKAGNLSLPHRIPLAARSP